MSDVAIDRVHSLEFHRVLGFRRGLDALRNLAVAMLTGMVLVTFGLPESGHLVLFFGSLAIFAVAIFEARLFQQADASERRLYEIERNYAAPALDPTLKPDPAFRTRLAESLLRGQTMGFVEAIAGRVLSSYFVIFLALDSCWLSKIYLYPAPAESIEAFVHRVDLGIIPGWFVLLFLVPFWGSFIVLSIWFIKKHPSTERPY